MNPTPNFELNDILQKDQQQEATKRLADTVGVYYETLRAHGMRIDFSEHLTMMYQQIMFQKILDTKA